MRKARESGALLKPWHYKVAGVFVSALFVYLAVRKVDLSESVRLLGTVHLGWLSAAALLYLCAYPFRALRWRGILREQKTISFEGVLVPTFIGYMLNNILPARAGEVYRAHLLGRRAQISRSGAAGSIVVERAFDGVMLVGLVLLLFVLFPQTRFLGGAALATGLIFLALAAGILFYSFAVDGTHRVIDKVLGIVPQGLEESISRRVKFFLRGIRGVSTFRGCLEALVYTVLIWVLEMSAFALVVISFDVTLPPSGYLLVYTLAALGTALPSGPAYIGPLQYAFVLSLGFFAISQETALAISVAAQFALLGSVTVIGLILLWKEQLRPTRALPSRPKKPQPSKEKVG
jgi:glycosyltransferase 2 family protein